MLVFLSDTHLTDGKIGDAKDPGDFETLKGGAFQKFTTYLEQMADKALENSHEREVEIVLLGDIFDVIRSKVWLDTDVRPWSPVGYRDGVGKSLEDYTLEIVDKIIDNEQNKSSHTHLAEFVAKMAKKEKPIHVNFTYIIGNHDWLINQFPSTRKKMAEFLNLDQAHYEEHQFETFMYWDKYRVFARHGDIYDPWNFEGDRNASSLGDAIVIELLTRFSYTVESQIGRNTDPDLVDRLSQIDYIKHYADIPAWIIGACNRARNQAAAEKVKRIWGDLVRLFNENEFVAMHNTFNPLDLVDKLHYGLGVSNLLTFPELDWVFHSKLGFGSGKLWKKAYNEQYARRHQAEFILYGHTHEYEIVPLDIIRDRTKDLEQIYFNTGTWRKLWSRTVHDATEYEFMNWNTMTFIVFYLDDERLDRTSRGGPKEGRKFEVWNGALD